MSCPGKLLITYENFTGEVSTLDNGQASAVCSVSCDCKCKCCRGISEKYVAFNRETKFSGFERFPIEFSTGGGDAQKMMRFRTAEMLLLLQAAQSRDNFWTNMFFKLDLQEDYQFIIKAFQAKKIYVSQEKLEEIMDTVTTGYRSAISQLLTTEAYGALRPTIAAPFVAGLRCGCQECTALPWRKLSRLEQHQKEHRLADNFHCRICFRRFYLQHSLTAHLTRKMNSNLDELMENTKYKMFLEDLRLREKDNHARVQTEELLLQVPKDCNIDFVAEPTNKILLRKICKFTKCPFCQEKYRFPFSHQLHMIRHRLRVKETMKCDHNFTCFTCNRSFLTRWYLKRHQERIRSDCRLRLRPFKCRSCPWRFQLWPALKSHVFRMHQRRKPCLICQAPTLGRCCSAHTAKECREAINKHREKRRLEKGPPKVDRKRPKPICESCGQTFETNFHLREHVNKKHLKKRNFFCEICGAAFYTQGLMQTHRQGVHLLTHTVHCDVCNMTIKAKGNYQRHLKSQKHLDALAKLEQQPGNESAGLKRQQYLKNTSVDKPDKRTTSRFQKPGKIDFCLPCGQTIVGQILRHNRSNKHKLNLIKYNDKVRKKSNI
ncbi:zinc finger and BTB domain-containing protein 41 [Drosophila bipectinata]|uniref:zinc finger and BTB domain-containing protein 41 n=1 Tax=Drosophila bipectinata TaxID=42026 RepID=UPI001C892012|nr:zinc finger protein 60 [Drosophila bipectinata]